MTLHQSYIKLRQKHPRFIYHRASWEINNNILQCFWHFEIKPNLEFHPTLSIPLPDEKQNTKYTYDRQVLDWLVFQIGMVESLSYWKLTAAPEIIVEAGGLTDAQINWWHKLLINGMGEYFFVNNIDFTQDNFIKIVADSQNGDEAAAATLDTQTTLNSNAYLIPIGGGKDSVVTLELLKLYQAINPSVQLLTTSVNPTQASLDVIDQGGLKLVNIKRQLDPQLLALNQQGYLNGHTPFSALLAFTNSLAAYLYNYQHVVISNEQSANEGNIQFFGQSINHQYSKSYAFEHDFRQYLGENLSVNYFSLLRPLNELQIAKIFAQLGKQYFHIFRSCNHGQKTNSWCGQCAKCLFAWTILFPFLDENTMIQIFGQNLFDNPKLVPIAHELVGMKTNKPFDCVGTYLESKAAFWLAVNVYQKNHLPLPKVLDALEKNHCLTDINQKVTTKILKQWATDHFLSISLGNFLYSYVKP